jgi:hypothetical protein
MCDEAEPYAISELAELATITLENFCSDFVKTKKGIGLKDSDDALIGLMGLALYWLWVSNHFIDLEGVLKAVQSKAEAWIDADPDVTPWTGSGARKIDPGPGRLH